MDITRYYQSLTTTRLGRTFAHFAQIDSTSTYLRQVFPCQSHGYTVLANEQLSGRGRTGNSFYSPKNGLYMSILLTDERYTQDALFTLKVCLAVCRAVDTFCDGKKVGIKWVNDIFYKDKKLCGILSEAVSCREKAAILLGIGINLQLDRLALPSEIRHKVCSMRDVTKNTVSKEVLAARIINEIERLFCEDVSGAAFITAYKSRSVILDRKITVTKNGVKRVMTAKDFTERGELITEDDEHTRHILSGGEIHIKLHT